MQARRLEVSKLEGVWNNRNLIYDGRQRVMEERAEKRIERFLCDEETFSTKR
jgi:hypothetical protein